MENRFNDNRDFEHFVKQNADQYRMFPSEKVWKGIHNTLHTRRRWYGIGLGLLILTTGVVTWVMLTNSGKNRQVISAIPETIVQQPAPEVKQKPAALIAPVKTIAPANNKISFIASASTIQQDLFIADNPAESGANNMNIVSSIETPVIAYNDPSDLIKASMAYQPESVIKTSPVPRQVMESKPATSTFSAVRVQDYSFIPVKTNTSPKAAASIAEENWTKDKNDIYPLSIESVVNSFIQIQKKRKTSLQVYITPTISYRALRENKAFINSARNAVNGTASNSSTYYTDINNIVTHKPDIGMQMGFSAGFPISKNLTFIGGLQFNVSKYDIQAFSHPGEVATIALSNPSGGTNTVSTLTNYRNAGGYKADWLHNLYFSIAAPVGLELKLMGKRKTYVGVSGTVQPTYILSNRAYLLSTDYKNYAEVPSLTRKWNINTGFEMFAGYSTGKLKWRIGPQVRYQLMSSFVKKYPVQEHLFDFGLKLGLMLNK